ncbi:MAG: PfkB family carbohydrate kinase, partial [Spirochaetota bacterium]
MSRITVFGSTNLDILYKQDRLNRVGETIIVKEAVVCGGGKGANQAVQIARLGHHPRFVTPLGTDALAQSLRDELSAYGLPLQDALIKEGSSGVGLVSFLSDGSLTSTVVEGANGKVELSDLDTCRSLLQECDFL